MASTAIITQGTTITVEVATVATPIANVVSFDGFDGESNEIDVTNLTSTAKEYLLGLQDFGQLTLTWHPDFNDAGQNELRTLRASGAAGVFQMTLSDGATIDFNARVRATPSSGGVDAALEGSCTLRITGEPTITPAGG